MKKFFVLVIAIVFISGSVFAQESTVRKKSGPRRQLATIVFAGLGGAILGLSTLSFYGRPQDNLSNIAIGFAIGVIAGTAYVTFRSATTRDYYDDRKLDPNDPNYNGSPQGSIEETPKLQLAPMIAKSDAAPQIKSETTALGGQLAYHF